MRKRKPSWTYCHYCGLFIEGRDIEWDHIVPRIKGGKNNPENLVECCVTCNRLKGSMSKDEFMDLMERYPIPYIVKKFVNINRDNVRVVQRFVQIQIQTDIHRNLKETRKKQLEVYNKLQ